MARHYRVRLIRGGEQATSRWLNLNTQRLGGDVFSGGGGLFFVPASIKII